MRTYCLKHVSDQALDQGLATLDSQLNGEMGELLAYLAACDERRRWAALGYSSLHDYCVSCLHWSEDEASDRIRAARKAAEFPLIFEAVAQGWLRLTGVRMLAPHLTPGNAEELILAVRHKSKAEIAQLLAERFPSSGALTLEETVPARVPHPLSVPERITSTPEPAPAAARVRPVGHGCIRLTIDMDAESRRMLSQLQDLLGHRIPSRDVAEVLRFALRITIRQIEKRKFGATDKPRTVNRPSRNPRHIPARVRRAVWQRDQGQCTFVGETGHRCDTRSRLEFDHIDPVARGGTASVDNLRLRCATHNRLEAERVFGAGWMAQRREDAKRIRASKPAPPEPGAETEQIISGLRRLGFRADEARRAAVTAAEGSVVDLEQKMKAALSYLCPRRPPFPAVPSTRAGKGTDAPRAW